MKARKTSQENKELDYKKVHFSTGENPHRFRRNWPRKEARANRKYRRQIAQLLDPIENGTVIDNGEEFRAKSLPIRRDLVRKWGATTLSDRVTSNLEYRVGHTGWNYFKTSYNSALHRESFSRFLTALTNGKNEHSRDLALHFNEFLDPPEITKYPRSESWYAEVRGPSWLKAFFLDEPEWETRLRAWIISLTSQKLTK